jgi:hypothetical protein
MGLITRPLISRTEYEFSPYTDTPLVSDDIQQALSRLVAWDSAAELFRFVRVSANGYLIIENAPSPSGTASFSRAQPSAVATLIVSPNTDRRNLQIKNIGSMVCYIGDDNTVAVSTGYPLGIGEDVIIEQYYGSIYAIVSAGKTDVAIWEVG